MNLTTKELATVARLRRLKAGETSRSVYGTPDDGVLRKRYLEDLIESRDILLRLMPEDEIRMRPRQSQAALHDQLRRLVVIANEHGLYDAADFVRDGVPLTEQRT